MTPAFGRPRRSARAVLAALTLLLALPVTATGGGPPPANPSLVVQNPALPPGTVSFVPLINSGDSAFGEVFEGIPDGIGAVPRKRHFPEWLPYLGHHADYVDLYVNHEQSHVPFPISSVNPGGPPIVGTADHQDASVTRVRVSTHPPYEVMAMDVVLGPEAGFIRFCSSFMAGPREGFPFHTLLLNEESNDILPVPPGGVYGPDPSASGGRQAGYAAWFNTVTGKYDAIAGAGRHNHENTVVVPGGWPFKVVSLSGDDTFTSTSSPTRPNLSQLYMYLGRTWLDYTRDRGTLYAFQVTATHAGPVDPMSATTGANDVFEIGPGTPSPWKGRFIPVPESVARGTDPSVLPQDALEDWSNANNVFQFIRVEDIDYDPDNPRVVYFADTGNSRLIEWNMATNSPGEGRLHRLGSMDPLVPLSSSSVGRIYKMVFNRHNPLIVDEFSVVTDASSIKDAAGRTMLNPDNLDAGSNSLMVQEDATNAHIWRWDYGSTWTHVATVDQDGNAANSDPGESSGILDVSRWFGPGWWALDVQSHTNDPRFVDLTTYFWPDGQDAGTDPDPYMKRRENGQLLLMHVPGS
jgi:hypothetical protein